jgi:tryptophanase
MRFRELVSLAMSRRTYTRSHIVAEVVALATTIAGGVSRYRIRRQAPWLRHLTAEFEPIGDL